MDLHCLQRQGISGLGRTRVNRQHCSLCTTTHFVIYKLVLSKKSSHYNILSNNNSDMQTTSLVRAFTVVNSAVIGIKT